MYEEFIFTATLTRSTSFLWKSNLVARQWGVGSWLVLTQAGRRQQGCPSLHLLRTGWWQERLALGLFHTTPLSPHGSREALLRSLCHLENEYHLCLILMQPINLAASLQFVHLGHPVHTRISLSYYSLSIQEALLIHTHTHPLSAAHQHCIAAAFSCIPVHTRRGSNLCKDKMHACFPPSKSTCCHKKGNKHNGGRATTIRMPSY